MSTSGNKNIKNNNQNHEREKLGTNFPRSIGSTIKSASPSMTYQAAISTSSVMSSLLLCGESVTYEDHGIIDDKNRSCLSQEEFETDSMEILGQIRVACISSSSSCSSWTVIGLLIFVYLAVAAIANLISLYKFVRTWNLIVQERRLDLEGFVHWRQRLTMKEALRTHVTMDTMTCVSCCICMSDFEENELVTACDEGCHKWFHRECLFTWLDRSNDCPCCRIDMLATRSPGMLSGFWRVLGLGE